MTVPPFARVPPELDFPAEERETLRFWRERRIFEKTLAKPSPKGRFVFYEGPPTANGLPHNGHVLTRVIKDLFPRYKTMRGWSVPRKAGWDTHGLPVEVEVEKELRIHGKAAIEEYGVEPFVKKCIESVFRYTKEWEELTERVAFWVDLGDAYVTYHRSYVESVWWALSKLFDKGLLYQGHKVVWWWAQGGTALSSGEVGLGYRPVDDPSVYVAFPLRTSPRPAGGGTRASAEPQGGGPSLDGDLSLLVWTTTPWTLPSNMYAAVRPELEYVVARAKDGRRFVLAEGLLEAVAKKLGGLEVEADKGLRGADLVGRAYRPPFRLFEADARGFEDVVWRVVAADFVTLDAGTGIVHVAPAFGEDDHEAHRKLLATRPGIPLFCAVKPDGTFFDRFERYAGRWVKDCDEEIQHDLEDQGLLVFAEQYRHDYPFCWRADGDPLIQYARPAWYIRTTAKKEEAIANNRAVRWLPEHIKEGRFGDFLANNVDWALSRERYWGTPLNLWICDEDATHRQAPASLAEIERKNPRAFDHFHEARAADPSLSEHLIIHKPWIDQVVFPCPRERCGGTMRRVPDVVDCWFDSGCMPFAQWGWPHQNRGKLAEAFPADFISEAIDQTRGWFYSLLMIATLVFDEPLPRPFRTCMVLGHVTDKTGKKESKSKGNYTPPEIILDEVKMDFAVANPARFDVDVPNAQTAVISQEDLEGMDLGSGATVEIRSAAAAHRFVLNGIKKAPRRVVFLHEQALKDLAVVPTSKHDIKPVEVPWLDPQERVSIKDVNSAAPGADAFRWFFYAASPPWSATRHSLSNVRALQKEFAVKLRNVHSFFVIYANIDGFDPGVKPGAPVERPELDRWLRSELALTVREVTARMDDYDVYGATQRMVAFVDALSNWWVRRSRARFWRGGWDDDKRSAYETLYAALVTLAKITAPFTPYGAEAMYQNLVVRPRRGADANETVVRPRRGADANETVVRPGLAGAKESVHLEDWPEADERAIDERLSRKVDATRALVSLGLQVRTQAKIKVRQPLRAAKVVTTLGALLDAPARAQLREELNVVQDVEVLGVDAAGDAVEVRLKPSFRALGQRGLGKEAQALKKTMAALPPAEAAAIASRLLSGGGEKVTLEGVELAAGDVEVAFAGKEGSGFAAAGDRAGVVLLDTRLDDELRELGFVRELVSRLQAARKEMGLEYTDRVRVTIAGSERVVRVVGRHRAAVAQEVLALEVAARPREAGDGDGASVDVEGESVAIVVTRVRGPAAGGPT